MFNLQYFDGAKPGKRQSFSKGNDSNKKSKLRGKSNRAKASEFMEGGQPWLQFSRIDDADVMQCTFSFALRNGF